MRLFSAIALVLAVLALGPRPAVAVDEAKERDIVRLMELTGAINMGKQVVSAMVPNMMRMIRGADPGKPEEFFALLEKTLRAEFTSGLDEIVPELVKIYDRHLSHDDLKALIAFYSTPVGGKVIRVMPRIMSESMAFGRQWGQDIGQRGYDKARREFEAGRGGGEPR